MPQSDIEIKITRKTNVLPFKVTLQKNQSIFLQLGKVLLWEKKFSAFFVPKILFSLPIVISKTGAINYHLFFSEGTLSSKEMFNCKWEPQIIVFKVNVNVNINGDK
jgi:hypothetical protein